VMRRTSAPPDRPAGWWRVRLAVCGPCRTLVWLCRRRR
jgi:hypothetical protein